MARTRGTANQVNPKLPSDRKVDASVKEASAAKSKNKTTAKPRKGKKINLDEDSNGGEDFDIMKSAEYDSEDYYPTKIAKKHDSQKLDAGENKEAVNKTSKAAQKQLVSETSHKRHKSTKSSLPSSSSKPTAATRIICVACHDAHAKCNPGKGDVSGQPCDRCARLGLECIFDPNYKRGGRRPSLPVGKMVKDKKTTTGQESKEEEVNGDISSEDPLNSPAPTTHVISRQTRTKTRTASGRFTKTSRAKDHSSSSSPLSSAPEESEDELDITMTGAKQQTNVAMPSTLKSYDKPLNHRSAARKGPCTGIPPPNSSDNNTKLDDHDLSSSMTDPVPQQSSKLDDSSILPGTKPVVIEGQDKDKEQQDSCDDTAIDSASNPGSVSHFHSASPLPSDSSLPANQPTKEFTLASPGIKLNTPTFLPEGHGSVLNPDMVSEQQQQQSSPLPPISQLGPGGAYKGRYDTTTLPPPTTSMTPVQATQVPIMTSSQILPAPPTLITHNNHTLFSTAQTNINSNTSSSSSSPYSSHPNYMPPEGSPAYRYSATKILFLLKHSQRAQLLAIGDVHLAPDAIAQLTNEIEDTRARALRLWYEVHDGLAVGEQMYDEGGLRFFEEFGRSN